MTGPCCGASPLDAEIPDEERGPGSTPAVGDGRAYVLSPACQLRALELATGKLAWHVDMKARFDVEAPVSDASARRSSTATASIVQTGAAEGTVVAASIGAPGSVAWSAKGVARANYSAPGRPRGTGARARS